jgi:hydroxymethylpyrimidine pyrophosphatase-like HAD family hydrolase
VHCGREGEGWLVVEATPAATGLVAYYLERAKGDVRTVADLLEALADEDPIQVMFGGTAAEMTRAHAALTPAVDGSARIERTVYPATGVVLLDVIHPGVGKAEALAFVQSLWGVSADETLAIGDNWNDREMVAAAGLGFVMGNADPELLALGLPALPTNDEDGVARAIEEHVLARA